MSLPTDETAERLGWTLVTAHKAGVPTRVILGEPEDCLGVDEQELIRLGLEERVVGQGPTPRPWDEPCGPVQYLLRDSHGEAKWVESRSQYDGKKEWLLVATRVCFPGDSETLLATARLALGASLLGPVTHELNNIVQSVSSVHYLLADAQDQGQSPLPEDIQQLGEAATDLKRLAAELQRFARIPLGEVEELSVAESIKNAVETLQEIGTLKTQEVTLNLTEPLPMVRWKRSELDLVCMGLVLNAAESNTSPERSRSNALGPLDQIAVSVIRRGSALELSIQDTGLGVAGALDIHPFATKKATHRHLGLGLPVISAIVASRGGTMEFAQNKSGQGVTVTVRLPVLDRET